jgi:hypothetical protein
MAYVEANSAALTYTIEDFISMKYSDDLTYRNFTILEVIDNIELVDKCLLDDYLYELEQISISVELTSEEYNKYKYAPDLLAYDIYGSTQLDFVILAANDMIDPKEFDLKTIKLPYSSSLKSFLSSIYSTNSGYLEQNRYDNNLTIY